MVDEVYFLPIEAGVTVLGTPIDAIRATEGRSIFNARLAEIDVQVARSRHADTAEQVIEAARTIGLPVILRAGFSLGGKGAATARTEDDVVRLAPRALGGGRGVLVKECLSGWKEIEYEIVRDGADDALTICNMENVDLMEIHTASRWWSRRPRRSTIPTTSCCATSP